MGNDRNIKHLQFRCKSFLYWNNNICYMSFFPIRTFLHFESCRWSFRKLVKPQLRDVPLRSFVRKVEAVWRFTSVLLYAPFDCDVRHHIFKRSVRHSKLDLWNEFRYFQYSFISSILEDWSIENTIKPFQSVCLLKQVQYWNPPWALE